MISALSSQLHAITEAYDRTVPTNCLKIYLAQYIQNLFRACLRACFSICVRMSSRPWKMKSWNENQHAQWGPKAEIWINDAKQERLKGACGILFSFHCLVEDNRSTMQWHVCKMQAHASSIYNKDNNNYTVRSRLLLMRRMQMVGNNLLIRDSIWLFLTFVACVPLEQSCIDMWHVTCLYGIYTISDCFIWWSVWSTASF